VVLSRSNGVCVRGLGGLSWGRYANANTRDTPAALVGWLQEKTVLLCHVCYCLHGRCGARQLMLASTLIIRVRGVWVCSRNWRCLVSWVLCLPNACRIAARIMSSFRRRAAVGLWHDAVQLEPSSCYTPIHRDMYLQTHAHSNAHTHAQYLTHHITRTQRLFEQHVRDKPFCTPEICVSIYLYVYVYF